MRSHLKFFLMVALTFSSSYQLPAQTPAPTQQQDEPKVRIGTAEVALDVVVRDKKGRPVRDLTAADFEVYEDGVPQTIESFRLVYQGPKTPKAPKTPNPNDSPARDAKTPATVPATAPRDSSEPGVVAMVFDRLTPESRTLARKAAAAYADEGLMVDDFVGVFAIDLSLHTIQPYTDDPQLVKRAVEDATSRSVSTSISNTSQVRNLARRGEALDRQEASSISASGAAMASANSAGAAAAGEAAGRAFLEQSFVQMQIRMSEAFDLLERDQQGFATVNGLLALINSMRNLPGRKTMLFFSEGLSLPTAVVEQFKSVINAANRANVSIYAIDAEGLRIESTTLEATRELNSMAARRMNQVHTGRDVLSGPMMKGMERNEDLLRLNPHSGLGDLADQTGGFLIHDTNDLNSGLRRIDEDMRVHYLVTYVPKNQEYDGHFRQISLKLSRPNLEVQTRKGYYAIDNFLTTPVLNYEVPALAALGRAKSGRNTGSFPIRVGCLSFPAPDHPGLTPILIETPASAFTFTPDKEKKTYSSDFSILALVRDETKQVVRKLSKRYPMSGPIDKIDDAKKGDILFYREVELPPGRYSVETVAYDAPTGKASVRSTSLEVPDVDETKPRLSSLTLLKRAEQLSPEERKTDHPLHFGEVVVYPNLGEPLRKSAINQLAFFFTAWPAKGATGKLQLTIEIFQNSRRLAQVPAELPAADEQGCVKYASSLPLDKFQPGSYELRMTVRDEQNSVSRATQFEVKP